jgi:BASS family bile acid:Na+ symporter
MSAGRFIERYFWLFLTAGIVLGLWNPIPVTFGQFLPKILLGLMLFFVFLKIDTLEVLENMRNFRLMAYITLVYMFIIPLAFYFAFVYFNEELAIGILLLTAMPAGVSTPALADIAKGNVSLSMSLAIVGQVVAPFTVPFLFWLVDMKGLDIDQMLILRDIAILVFIPMIIAEIIKRNLPILVKKAQHFFTSANVLILVTFVYVTLASQRGAILENPLSIIWKIVVLYIVFILLHVIGYYAYLKGSKESRISVAIGAAYMNNGMAIVLAASYFSPEVLVLMVLSEFPWNTMLEPFKRVMRYVD